MPATPKQERLVTTTRDLVWRFYKALKVWKQRPSPHLITGFRRRFDKIFARRTGYAALDKLLLRLHRRKAELLKVLEHRIFLCTPMRRRTIFVPSSPGARSPAGTISVDGRIARDVMLGLMKTCQSSASPSIMSWGIASAWEAQDSQFPLCRNSS
ncbi:hypothetical protein LOF17_00010 [Sinorhizobium meliloti]|uniref:hypothetical protein n=1 Tax=Rhizobium meliloti TaxID=382 RepID=UPI0023815ADF|nr:hypothetical protein [Sinorhizobium meliloti]MDE4586298.1 hypothetical protein [Sinorhizobium meliloti]